MEYYSAIKWNEITIHATAGVDLKRIRLSGKRPIPKCYTHKEKNLRNVDQIHRYQGLGTRRGGEVHKETGWLQTASMRSLTVTFCILTAVINIQSTLDNSVKP